MATTSTPKPGQLALLTSAFRIQRVIRSNKAKTRYTVDLGNGWEDTIEFRDGSWHITGKPEVLKAP